MSQALWGFPALAVKRTIQFAFAVLSGGKFPAAQQKEQPGCGRWAVHPHALCSWVAALPWTLQFAARPGAAAAWAGTGSKESCLLWGKDKGFLNLSVLKFASALRALCSLGQGLISKSISRLLWVLSPPVLCMDSWVQGTNWRGTMSVCPGGSIFLLSAHLPRVAVVPWCDRQGHSGCPRVRHRAAAVLSHS